MVADVASIQVSLELLGAGKFQADMRGSASVTEQTGARVSRSMDQIANSGGKAGRAIEGMSRGDGALRSVAISALRAETSMLALNKAFTLVGTAVAGLAGGVAINAFKNYADAATTIGNKLAVAIPIQTQRAAIDKEIYDTAQRTRTSYEATAALFSRMSLSSKELGASQKEILKVTETTQKSLRIGGATSGESASIATQLTQALGSGRGLAGDELKSIAENAPVLLQAIADEFGVTTGALKDMGANGELEAKRVFQAILKAGTEVDRLFKNTSPTIADGVQQIDNALTRYIGNVDKSIGATKALSGGLEFVAKNMSSIGDGVAVALAAIGGSLLGRGVQSGSLAVTAPFRAARKEARDALEAAKELQKVRFEETAQALQGSITAALRAKVVSETPSTALAGSKAVADLLTAEKRIAGQRELLADATKKVAAAEKYRNEIATATMATSKQTTNAQERAERALENRRKELELRVRDYATAAPEIASAKGSLSPKSEARYQAALAERAELNKKLAEVDARSAAARDMMASIPGTTTSRTTQERAAAAKAMTESLEKEKAERNRVGRELQNAIRAATAQEETLQAANNTAKTKAAAEVERIGARLVTAETAVVNARKDLSAKEAATASGQGRVRSTGSVVKAIEDEIRAQERLAKAIENRDRLSSVYLDKAARAPNATGSLNPSQVKALSEARAARDFLTRELDEIDRQIATKTAERDRTVSSINPQGARNLVRDAANEAQRSTLNAGLQADAMQRAEIVKNLERSNKVITSSEATLAERTATARQKAIAATVEAGARLRDVQTALASDLANLNTRRQAIINSEVENEEARARKLLAIDQQITEAKKNQKGIQQAVDNNALGVQRARDAVRLDAEGKGADAIRAQADAEAAIQASRKASTEVATSVARAERMAGALGLVRAVGATASAAYTGLVGLLGGPVAAGFTAVSVAVAGNALIQARAAAEVEKHSAALKTLIQRTDELREAQKKGEGRTQAQVQKDLREEVDSLRSVRDQRNKVGDQFRSATIRAVRAAGADDPDNAAAPTVIDKAAETLGIDLSKTMKAMQGQRADTEEAVKASQDLANILTFVANIDPGYREFSIQAQEFAAKQREAAQATREFQAVASATKNATPRNPLDVDVEYRVGEKFNGTAGAEAIKEYLKEVGDEIVNLNETPIDLKGLDVTAGQVSELVKQMAMARNEMQTITSGVSLPAPVAAAMDAFKAGKTSAAEYGAELVALREKYPDFGPLIDSLIKANDQLLTAQATAQGVGLELDGLNGRVVNVLIKIATQGGLPDIAAMQAKADKALADQTFNNNVARLRSENKGAEADIMVAQRATPRLDTNAYKAGLLDAADIARAERNKMPDLKAEIDDSQKKGTESVNKMVEQTAVTRLKAAGKSRDAALREFRTENPTVEPGLAERVVDEKIAADKALDDYNKSQRPGKKGRKGGGGGKKSQEAKDGDTLAKKLQELDQDAEVSTLGSAEEKTVRFAQSAKVATDQINQFIAAAKSGNLKDIPPTMQEIYEKVQKLAGVKLAENALDQIFPARKLARDLEALKAAADASPEIAANLGLIEMKLRSDAAPEWGKSLTTTVSDTLKSVINGTSSIGNAMEKMVDRIANLAIEQALKPGEQALNSFFGALSKNGFSGMGNAFSSMFGGATSNGLGSIDGAAVQGPPAPPGYAAGVTDMGEIQGPGTGTSDSILAMVSKGESIINAKATNDNKPLIRAMNAGKFKLPKFANGMLDGRASQMSGAINAVGNTDSAAALRSSQSNPASGMKVEIVKNGTPAKVENATVETNGRGERTLKMQMGDVVATGSQTPQAQRAMRQRRTTKR